MLRVEVRLEGERNSASRNLSLVALRDVGKAAWQLRLLALDEDLDRVRRNVKATCVA
jgi:hypothetical protein